MVPNRSIIFPKFGSNTVSKNQRFDPVDQAEQIECHLNATQLLLQHANQYLPNLNETSEATVLRQAGTILLDNSKLLLQKLKQVIQFDGLTLVNNRASFDKQLYCAYAKATKNKTPLAVVMIDLDRFKSINDTYGHPVGDLVLQHVAQVARDTLRGQAPLFRYGGEEFALILENLSQEEVIKMVETLRGNTAKSGRKTDPPALKKVYTERDITLSAGVVYHDFETPLPEAQASPKALLEMADKALYQAKQTGRNRMCLHTPISIETNKQALSPANDKALNSQ
jgi:diguanylate cyclase (GGDEF)-like protein